MPADPLSGERDKDVPPAGSGEKDQEDQSGAPQGATGSSSFTEAQALKLRSILREEIEAVITASSSPGQASK
eukprot:2286385-Pyramimonas_sp.AAC.1